MKTFTVNTLYTKSHGRRLRRFAAAILLLIPWWLPAQDIVKAEYFFNNDPGAGSGTDIPITAPAGNLENLSFVADVSELATGFNILFLRAKDASGKWTLTHQRSLYKTAMPFDLPEIVQAEYFFNTDPGAGMAEPIPPGSPSINVQNVTFTADVTTLNNGFNMLFVRARDASGRWSLTHQRPFYKATIANDLPDIVQAEYFFNTDPGFGLGTAIPVPAPAVKIEEITFVADVQALGAGFHTLFVRAKDGAGRWTHIHHRQFYKASVSNELPDIVQAEYYIDSDPGVGNGIAVPIPQPSQKIEDIAFVFDITELELGYHKTFLRAKDADGTWSLTQVVDFCKTPIPDFTTDLAEFGNPTTFTNLSQQYNQDTEFFWDVDGDDIYDYTGAENFLHLYPAPGSYLAKLKVLIPEGCFDIIQKEVLVYACMVPTNLTAGNITYNSAELDWTPGNFGSQWDLLWGLQGFDPGTEGTLIEDIPVHPYLLTGLEELTTYDVYVRTVCDDEVSEWSGPQTFTTHEYICEPQWTASPWFQYNMQVIGKLFIDGGQSFDPNDKIGAFVNGECRGIAAPDPDLFGLVFLTVGSDVASGEMVEFVIWNVAECAECSTGESVLFENQLQVGTPGNPYPFQCGLHELDLSFGGGYTWFSVNIDPGSMMLNDLFAGLNPCEEDRIIGQNTFAIFYSNEWMGSLNEISPAQMYKMQLCSQQSMTLEGQPADNNPITLGAGYNWLGYLPQGQQEINLALANLSPLPAEDNRLIGQNSFAVYYQGQWIGSLTQLEPGDGYIIELSSESTLTYPNAAGKENSGQEPEMVSPTGDFPMANLQYTMMLIAQIELPDGSISLNPENVVYAFSGDECRGMAGPATNADGVIFMSIGSDQWDQEEITFKAWLTEYGTLAEINETIAFESLKKAGTMELPVLLTLKGFTGNGESTAEGIFIGEPYPNPFTNSTAITCHLTVKANLKLTLQNAQGQQSAIISDREFAAGNHSLVINGNGLPAGIYFFRLEITGDQLSTVKIGKLIIK
jgi:hypothetical protein